MTDLGGITVLITRPRQQAEPWLAGFSAAGARVLHQPGLKVEPTGDDESSLAGLDDLPKDAVAVFTSKPAADAALARQPALTRRRCWAVGRQTARRLIELGCRKVYVPESGAGVEALLADPRFPDSNTVVIACARGGRGLLADRLAATGRTVRVAYVYRRTPAAAELAPEAVRDSGGPLVTVVTSIAILDRIHQLLGASVPLTDHPLVVISERIAGRAATLGYRHIVVAGGPGLDSVLAATAVACGRLPDPHG